MLRRKGYIASVALGFIAFGCGWAEYDSLIAGIAIGFTVVFTSFAFAAMAHIFYD